MVSEIPPIDPDLSSQGAQNGASRELLELEVLDLEAALKRLAKKEIGQRYAIKWIAVITGALVIVAMLGVLSHLFHHVFWGPFLRANAAFAVAMIVAPIASITAITVALFIGAFRKFDDKDLENAGSGAASAFNMFRGG